jgi:DNA-binding MarR family transcriptional regulator
MMMDFRAATAPRRRLPPLLRRAWFGLNQAFRHLAGGVELTPDQYTVLRILREHQAGHLTQRALVERMSSDPNTVTSLLRRMEKQGLVEKQAHPDDRRAHCLVLTAAGRRTHQEARRLAMALQKSVLAVLPEAEREPFLARLEKVADACWQAAQLGRAGVTNGGERRTRGKREE